MKNKISKICVALILIGLIVNVTVFAEPLNKTLNYKYGQEKDTNMEIFQTPSIISKSHANDLGRRDAFIISRDSLEYLFSSYKDIVRVGSAIRPIEYNGRIIGNLLKKMEEKLASQYVYLNHLVAFVKHWDGKDRIISLDLDGDENTFIFLN